MNKNTLLFSIVFLLSLASGANPVPRCNPNTVLSLDSHGNWTCVWIGRK